MIKNNDTLKIPNLELSVAYVINPTSNGPNNAANLPSILYTPKNSELLFLGIKAE